MIKIKNEVDLARDDLGVVHNTNRNAFNEFILKRNEKIKLENRINSLETDTKEIKDTLTEILKILRG